MTYNYAVPSLRFVATETAAEIQPDVAGQLSSRLRGGGPKKAPRRALAKATSTGRQTRAATRAADRLEEKRGTAFAGTGVNPRIAQNANKRAVVPTDTGDTDQEEEEQEEEQQPAGKVIKKAAPRRGAARQPAPQKGAANTAASRLAAARRAALERAEQAVEQPARQRAIRDSTASEEDEEEQEEQEEQEEEVAQPPRRVARRATPVPLVPAKATKTPDRNFRQYSSEDVGEEEQEQEQPRPKVAPTTPSRRGSPKLPTKSPTLTRSPSTPELFLTHKPPPSDTRASGHSRSTDATPSRQRGTRTGSGSQQGTAQRQTPVTKAAKRTVGETDQGTGSRAERPGKKTKTQDDKPEEEEQTGGDLGEEEYHELEQISDFVMGKSQEDREALIRSLMPTPQPERPSLPAGRNENPINVNRGIDQRLFDRIYEESVRGLSSSDQDQGWLEAYWHLDQVLKFLGDQGDIEEEVAAGDDETVQAPDPNPSPLRPAQYVTARRAFLHNMRNRKRRDRWEYLLRHETRARDGTRPDASEMAIWKQDEYKPVVAAMNALESGYLDNGDFNQFVSLILHPTQYFPVRTAKDADRLRRIQASENRFLTRDQRRQRGRAQRRADRAELEALGDARPERTAVAPMTVTQIAAEMNRQRQEQLAKSRGVEPGRRAWRLYPKRLDVTERTGNHPNAASFYYLGTIDLGSLNAVEVEPIGGGRGEGGGGGGGGGAGGGG